MKAFFGKSNPISRDLEIFTVPRIVGRIRMRFLFKGRVGYIELL